MVWWCHVCNDRVSVRQDEAGGVPACGSCGREGFVEEISDVSEFMNAPSEDDSGSGEAPRRGVESEMAVMLVDQLTRMMSEHFVPWTDEGRTAASSGGGAAVASMLSNLFGGTDERTFEGAGTAVNRLENVLRFFAGVGNGGNPRDGRANAATAARVLRSLVPERLTERDAEGTCAICQDNFAAGDEIYRLGEVAARFQDPGAPPCECTHIFHVSCVHPWLETHNSCPVCRHELPTDNPEYEQERRAAQSQSSPNR